MSFVLLKKFWKWWITRNNSAQKYTILSRRQVNYRNINRSRNNCRLLRGFYCAIDPLPAFILLAVIIVSTVMILKGTTVSDVKHSLGMQPPVAISISMLNVQDDINFPEGDKRIGYDETKQYSSKAPVLGNSENTVLWKVDGFNRYMEHFADLSDKDILGMFGKLQSEPELKTLNHSGRGFWVYRSDLPKSINEDATANGSGAAIHALKIIDHAGITPAEAEVAVALRAYVDGEVTIAIKYENLSNYMFETHIERFKTKGFCYKILDLPFDKRINSIHIRPTSTSLRRHGLVIVDQILIVVAKRDQSENFIHTLVPNDWC